ncbi:MAG: helix-hairpin-helix domain-containing protein [Patescibacteria group bacterium]|nr:helix-hairpin-helix domain-containing protein [Patescibacteria group bacterium]
MNKNQQLKELQKIFGVEKVIAEIFWDVGVKNISDLKKKNPEKLYSKIFAFKKCSVDRCVFYVCRYLFYFAENKKHNQEKLKWWNLK